MRNSKQRDLILKIVNMSHNHLSAGEIYEEALKIIPNISLGTVYRNLNFLVDTKKIMRIKTSEGKDRYDSNELHHHFICDKCNAITDIYQDFKLDLNILPNSKIITYAILFHGICENCLKKEEMENGIKRK